MNITQIIELGYIITNFIKNTFTASKLPIIISVVSLLVSIISILLPYIINFCKQSELHGKIISLVISQNLNHSIVGTGFGCVLKLSLIVLKKRFAVKFVEVELKFPKDINLYKGDIFRSNTFTSSFIGRNGVYKLVIPGEQDILSLAAMDIDKPQNNYLSFIVKDKETEKDFEEIILTFVDYYNTRKKITLFRKDISNLNAEYDESVWKPLL